MIEKGETRTLWYTQAGIPVSWRGVSGNQDTAFWLSPIFDLRPDLKATSASKPNGVPVWDPAARLYVQVFGLTATATTTENLRLAYRERASVVYGEVTQASPSRAVANAGYPNQVGRNTIIPVTPWIDITSDLMMGTAQPDSAVLVFEPLGSGYPVRFWQVELQWLYVGGSAGPSITIQAAMY